jgi:hypothetical protein
MSQARSDQLVRAAHQLDEQARQHKRAAERHRRAAQDCRTRQAELERQCAELGITIIYPTKAKDTLHGQRHAARPQHAD